MYSSRPGFTLGFHGCDKAVLEKVLNGQDDLKFSENSFDWLGNGIYFWKYSFERALEYATYLSSKQKNSIGSPAVIGAILDLGNCLDLIEYQNLLLLKGSYELFKDIRLTSGFTLPVNRSGGSLTDMLLRDLDCAVIESLHQTRERSSLPSFDSVKGVFLEGAEIYPNAGFREKNHIQICIRNPNCIKGFFLPRSSNDRFPSV